MLESWDEICVRLMRHEIREEKDGPGFVPAEFEPEVCRRAARNVRAITLLVLDIDDGTPLSALEPRLAGYQYVAYTTHSHSTAEPKYRLVFPLVRPVAPEEWRAVWGGAAATLAPGRVDTVCKDAARFYYFPACPIARRDDRWVIVSQGRPLDPDALAAAAPLAPPRTAAERPNGAAPPGRGDYRTLDAVAWFGAHGAYGRPLDGAKHAVLCPWQHEHTQESTAADSDTVIWEGGGGRWPDFFCAHRHCEGRGIRQVLELWGDADKFCAREFEPLPPGLRARSEPGGVPAPRPPGDLEAVLEAFRKWLYLPDDRHVKLVLGAYAANLLPGEPVWLMLISAPGSGKTELLGSLGQLPSVVVNSSLSGEGSLLSATPKRDRGAAASGGLLRQIGEFGILILKDFTSILQMKGDSQAPLLAALREVYDGSWIRRVGVDGGKTLAWSGKLGLIAGCTPIIDAHHAVLSAMGERFLFYRLRMPSPREQTARALRHIGKETEMRAELSQVVADLLAPLARPLAPAELSDAEEERLTDLAHLAVRCRSAVPRDRFSREIEFIPEPESPARLGLSLARLYMGLRAIGVDEAESWPLIAKAAVDSMPALRWAVLRYAWARPRGIGFSTADAAIATRHPSTTARRALQDLHAHELMERTKGGRNTDLWELSDWARNACNGLTALLADETASDQFSRKTR